MFFANPVIFELPVLPRVQKFIRTKLADAAGCPQPMLASPDCPGPGLMLWAMAQANKVALHTRYSRNFKGSRSYQPQALSALIGVGIYQFHPSRHQLLLNVAELWVFSNMVDHMLQNELVTYCQQAPEVAPLVRIKQFCDHYDFSEQDISEQALRQMYLRHRKGTGAHGFSVEIVNNFPFVALQLAA